MIKITRPRSSRPPKLPKSKRGPWAGLLVLLLIAGCTYFPANTLSLYQRSTRIQDRETEDRILSRASLAPRPVPGAPPVHILYLRGTPYEMGFQHGRLLKSQVRQAVFHILSRVNFLVKAQALDEVYDLISPYIPVEEQEEMRGLAHGAGLPLCLIHRIHILPELSEYRGRKKFSRKFKGTSCSNLAAFGRATGGRGLFQLRVLDWNRELGTQQWPVILAHRPDRGHPSVTFSFAGFIGAVSGMNARNMAFGEKGEGGQTPESLEGIPFVFLFRKLMREAGTIDQALEIIRSARRTCAYSYLISQAGPDRPRAVLVFSDRDRMSVYGPGQAFTDPRTGREYPGVTDLVYNGADKKILFQAIRAQYGRINDRALKQVAVHAAGKSNIQNVIFNPGTLESWVSHAPTTGRADRAWEWVYFDFKTAL